MHDPKNAELYLRLLKGEITPKQYVAEARAEARAEREAERPRRTATQLQRAKRR